LRRKTRRNSGDVAFNHSTYARRKFVDAVKVNPQYAEAVNMVTRVDALFLVDRDAWQKAMGSAGAIARPVSAHEIPLRYHSGFQPPSVAVHGHGTAQPAPSQRFT
jgi:hypothetical protein